MSSHHEARGFHARFGPRAEVLLSDGSLQINFEAETMEVSLNCLKTCLPRNSELGLPSGNPSQFPHLQFARDWYKKMVVSQISGCIKILTDRRRREGTLLSEVRGLV